MPEGPEIRRAADKIADVLEGKRIEAVRFGIQRLRKWERALVGARVSRVETRGKALLNHFDHGLTVYSHNQLYGIWRVLEGHELPDTKRSLRLLLQTATHSAILYSASDISVWPSSELKHHPFLAKLGPDIMDPMLGWRDVAARLLEPRFRNRELAALYLDQSFLAGNGNYLRSEVLFDAGVHPRSKPAALRRGQVGKLARSTLALSRRSHETSGITLPPRLAATLTKKGWPPGRRRFFVFGRAGQPCHRCPSLVDECEVGSRRLYSCPTCQTVNP